MSRAFSILTALLLLGLAALAGFGLAQSTPVVVAGIPWPQWAMIASIAIPLVLALGILFGGGSASAPQAAQPSSAQSRGMEARDLERGGHPFTVHQGRRYRANISLSFFEQVADNGTIAGMFEKAGFSDVRVTGSGSSRVAEGTWPLKDATANMPTQVVKATELPVVVAANIAPTPAPAPMPAPVSAPASPPAPAAAPSAAAGPAAAPAPSPAPAPAPIAPTQPPAPAAPVAPDATAAATAPAPTTAPAAPQPAAPTASPAAPPPAAPATNVASADPTPAPAPSPAPANPPPSQSGNA